MISTKKQDCKRENTHIHTHTYTQYEVKNPNTGLILAGKTHMYERLCTQDVGKTL